MLKFLSNSENLGFEVKLRNQLFILIGFEVEYIYEVKEWFIPYLYNAHTKVLTHAKQYYLKLKLKLTLNY